MTDRLTLIHEWLTHTLGIKSVTLTPASGDASFRRYLRAHFNGQARIVMDAPPGHEDCTPYIKIANALHAIGLNVPVVEAQDLERGFLLLSDLGTTVYLDVLNEDTVERLYGDALGALLTLQALGPGADLLPPYDRALLLSEMQLFYDWYLGTHKNLNVSEDEQAALSTVFDLLADEALAQPKVAVHRDYHSRNLMVTETNNPGILDFQDAVFGPVTYDLVSLLRDCYVAWPRTRVEDWALGYLELALQSGVLNKDQLSDERQFMRWFDLMGVQRHLKASGIFARLNHRDGKPGYLDDIPRTLDYVLAVATHYDDLMPLSAVIERVKDW